MFRVDASETELFVKLLNGSEIHVVGLDKPERIEGQPWNGCHITEFGNIKEGAWGENIRPVLSDTNGFAFIDGVPEGRNHYYDLALYGAGGAIPEVKEIVGGYAENPDDPEWAFYCWFSSDVLSSAEIASARKHLDEKTFRQEYQGSFESFEGLAYWAFGQHNLEMVEYNQNEPVAVGMDFNVNPMTATLGHIRNDEYNQFGELYLNNSNTYEMRDALKERYKSHQVFIYPDSTGRARESNATESDLQILQQAGFRVMAKPSNPYVKDRVNSVNSVMRSSDGYIRYHVNPQKCPKTINDFNKGERLPDGRLNKTQEDMGLHHISAALGYLIYYNWPIKRTGLGAVKRAV